MAAEGFAVMEWGNHWGLRGRQPAPQGPTRPLMVVPWARGVHVERATCPCHPAFPQGASLGASSSRFPKPPSPISELGDELGPDRDHPDKQRDRRQCGCFFDENLQHAGLLKIGNIGRTLFPFCSLSQGCLYGWVLKM